MSSGAPRLQNLLADEGDCYLQERSVVAVRGALWLQDCVALTNAPGDALDTVLILFKTGREPETPRELVDMAGRL